MEPETNRIEYKQQLTDDLEKEAIAFLNYQEGGCHIHWNPQIWNSSWCF